MTKRPYKHQSNHVLHRLRKITPTNPFDIPAKRIALFMRWWRSTRQFLSDADYCGLWAQNQTKDLAAHDEVAGYKMSPPYMAPKGTTWRNFVMCEEAAFWHEFANAMQQNEVH